MHMLTLTTTATPLLLPQQLGTATLVAEVSMPGSGHKVVKCTGVPNPGRTTTVLVRGSNRLVLDEAERSIHDALCVVRSLVKRRFLIAGGGAAEVCVVHTMYILY
jgi:T-complex protein 1 subunit delta